MIGITIVLVLVSAVLALATAFAITPLLMKLLKFVDVKTLPWAQQTTPAPMTQPATTQEHHIQL